jgi:hypothetical protein
MIVECILGRLTGMEPSARFCSHTGEDQDNGSRRGSAYCPLYGLVASCEAWTLIEINSIRR